MPEEIRQLGLLELTLRQRFWPWREGEWKPTPDDRVRDLAKAGALIAAEIDRIQRARGRHKEQTPIEIAQSYSDGIVDLTTDALDRLEAAGVERSEAAATPSGAR